MPFPCHIVLGHTARSLLPDVRTLALPLFLSVFSPSVCVSLLLLLLLLPIPSLASSSPRPPPSRHSRPRVRTPTTTDWLHDGVVSDASPDTVCVDPVCLYRIAVHVPTRPLSDALGKGARLHAPNAGRSSTHDGCASAVTETGQPPYSVDVLGRVMGRATTAEEEHSNARRTHPNERLARLAAQPTKLIHWAAIAAASASWLRPSRSFATAWPASQSRLTRESETPQPPPAASAKPFPPGFL